MLSRLYDMRTCGGPMFEQYFRAALHLVMADPADPGTLVDVPAVFESRPHRESLIQRAGRSVMTGFWDIANRAGGEASLANIAPYIVSKLNAFIHNSLIRPIIGQPRSTVDFRKLMDRRGILLVNLSRGGLGEMDMRLLGMIVLTKLMCGAMERMDTPTHRRTRFMVYVDEFQNFTTGATSTLLSESRKFGLCLTLANQNLSQLEYGGDRDTLMHSVLGNAGSMVFFRLGAPDAEKLSIHMRPDYSAGDLQALPNFHAAARLLGAGGPTRAFVLQTLAVRRPRVNAAVRARMEEVRRACSLDIGEVEERIRLRIERIHELDAKRPK